MRVKGQIVDAQNMPINDCNLELRLSENDVLVESQQVGGEFNDRFTVKPRMDSYYISVICPGRPVVKLLPFAFDGSSPDKKIVDLLTISVR